MRHLVCMSTTPRHFDNVSVLRGRSALLRTCPHPFHLRLHVELNLLPCQISFLFNSWPFQLKVSNLPLTVRHRASGKSFFQFFFSLSWPFELKAFAESSAFLSWLFPFMEPPRKVFHARARFLSRPPTTLHPRQVLSWIRFQMIVRHSRPALRIVCGRTQGHGFTTLPVSEAPMPDATDITAERQRTVCLV